jgi:acyl-CoA thioesterase-1
MSRFIFFFTVLCAAASASAATRNILVFGDSLSAGYGLRAGDAWPVLLASRLQEKAPNFSVANASISGETTAGGRTRLSAALRQYTPHVVILALGANDGLRGLPVDRMRDNLRAMIREAKSGGASVLLVGMELPPNYGPDYTGKFRNAFADLAREEKTAFVPFLLNGFGEKRELFQADTIHPTAAAQPLILENVWPALEPLLRTSAAGSATPRKPAAAALPR